MPQSDEAIRAYLLGLLPEADSEAVEEAYFADPEAFDRVRAVEDDLLDDHAAGRLGPAEKEAFEKRYLASEPLRRRVVAARALRMASSAAPARRAMRSWTWMAPLALAALFLVAVFGLEAVFTSRARGVVSPAPGPTLAQATPGASPASSPSVAGGSPSPGPKAPATSRLVLALSPTLLRGSAQPALLRPAGVETVVLELQGDSASIPAGVPLQASVETVEGTRAWSGRARPARSRLKPSVVATADVPAIRLAPGDYLLTLTAGGETLHRYFFRVAPR